MATPTWSAPRFGLLGDTGAVNDSSQINQLLGAHAITAVYQGNPVVTPTGSGGTAWAYQLSTQDISQPFTMSGTTIGRVTIPLLPVGNGADLIVSLCANSSGVPGNVITQTRIPANWITQLAAVSGVAGPSSTAPITGYTNSPLALAQFNSFHQGATTLTNWSYPTVFPGFSILDGAQNYYGRYFFVVGAQNGSTYFNNVYTIAYDTLGNLASAIPQPAFPVASGGSNALGISTDPASGNLTFVVAGGSTAPGVEIASVYTAAFDANAGTLSAWSSQANLPQALRDATFAAWNGYVYVVGGINAGLTADLNTVYFAQVVNGQITAWNTANPYPLALDSVFAAAINGFLVVVGGENFAGTMTTAVYYAPINSDGSLGAWQAGPPLPVADAGFQVGTPVFGTYGVMAIGNGQAYMLSFTANGPDIAWQTFTQPQGGDQLAEIAVQPGTWQHYGLYTSYYSTFPVTLTPRISVPLPTTGLSNGTTYHIVLSQPGGDLNNYLRTHDDVNVFPGNPTALFRPKGSATWTAGTSGHAIPLQVFDGSALGKVWHLWEDGGERVTTLAWGTTPNQPLVGILEATQQPGPVLNANYTFTSTLSPWGVNNGTYARSSAQTHGNLPFSALLTPTGGNVQSYIESERMTVYQQQSYTGSAWVYSPTGYNNVSVILNWYTSGGTFISSTFGTVFNVAANTWTFITATGTPPATATLGTFGIYEKGIPPNTALLYISAATYQNTSGPMVSSVAQYTYAATWPSPGSNTATGITVLA